MPYSIWHRPASSPFSTTQSQTVALPRRTSTNLVRTHPQRHHNVQFPLWALFIVVFVQGQHRVVCHPPTRKLFLRLHGRTNGEDVPDGLSVRGCIRSCHGHNCQCDAVYSHLDEIQGCHTHLVHWVDCHGHCADGNVHGMSTTVLCRRHPDRISRCNGQNVSVQGVHCVDSVFWHRNVAVVHHVVGHFFAHEGLRCDHGSSPTSQGTPIAVVLCGFCKKMKREKKKTWINQRGLSRDCSLRASSQSGSLFGGETPTRCPIRMVYRGP